MKKVEFTGALGETLAARLDEPEGTPKAYALFAHCFTCSKDVFAASIIAKALTKHGIAVLRFDFTGLGASEGDFANTNFTSNVKDLLKAADFMRAEFEAPQLIIGHSLGGAAVLVAAPDIPEIKAVVTLCAPADAAHVTNNFGDDKVCEIEEKGEAEVDLSGRPFKIQKQFLDDINTVHVDESIAKLHAALLIMHPPLDQVVGIENAEHIFRHAKHPKSFVSLDDADHLLRGKEHVQYAADVIAAWASRYIGYDMAEEQKPDTPVIDGVLVKSSANGRFQQIVQAGKHVFIADEPEDVGGRDSGPDPYSLLLASLGTCTSMTLEMYAKHKELPLEGVDVHLRHEKIHAEDCKDCETIEGTLDKITRAITIKGDKLSDEQRARLIEIANKCPVHKTLQSEIVIETSERSAGKAA